METWFGLCKENVKNNIEVNKKYNDLEKGKISKKEFVDFVIEKFGEFFYADDGK